MGLLTEFPYIFTGNLYTSLDTYASTVSTQPPTNTPSYPNGAYNPPGAPFLLAQGASEGPAIIPYTGKGWGAPLIVRYVRYNSTANPTPLTTPGAPVYWTDETFTTVSGVFSEGNPAGTGNINSFAGIMLLNSTSLSSLTAATLNGNWIWIVTGGFVPQIAVPASTAVGDALIGAAGNFTLGRVASGSAPTSSRFLQALTAVSGGLGDVLVNTEFTF